MMVTGPVGAMTGRSAIQHGIPSPEEVALGLNEQVHGEQGAVVSCVEPRQAGSGLVPNVALN